jgi:hypothetical protein
MYTLFSLPHGFNFQSLTREQAKENLRAVVERIPERHVMLEALVRIDLPEWTADYSEPSLSLLGEWYVDHVQERAVTESEAASLRSAVGEELAFIAESQVQLTRESYSFGIDVGLYLGECIKMRCPRSVWAVGPGPQSYINYNKPVLSGFKHSEFSPTGIAGLGIGFVRARRTRYHIGTTDPAKKYAEAISQIPLRNPRTMLVDMLTDRVSMAI